MSLGLYKREDTPHKIAQTHHTQEPSLEMVTPGSTHSVLTWPCGAGGTPGGMPRVLTRWAGLVMGKLHGRENQQIKSYSLLIAVFFTCTPQCNLHCGHRKQQHDTVTTYIRMCVHMLDTVTVTYDVVTTQDTVTAVTSVHTHSTWAASRARPWGQTLWDH